MLPFLAPTGNAGTDAVSNPPPVRIEFFFEAGCGNCEQVTEGAPQEAVLKKIRQQISKKFGAKGGAVVEGNMAVIQDGLAATQRVDYQQPEFALAETAAATSGEMSSTSQRPRVEMRKSV